MASLPKNNAFGLGSPSWNISFPAGNMTAAEILAYLPHWLKSIDVVDRFVSHGAKSTSVAAIINEFRIQPTGNDFRPNSAMIMMAYAMRRAGYEDWSVGTHFDFAREIERPEDDLDMKGFRTPRLTHPKDVKSHTPQKAARNQEAGPIDFKDLALHVKDHPSGDDALDLTRCVLYALDHVEEQWLFPTDFERLVVHLGGQAQVTHSHLDRQVFARRENYSFSPVKSTPGKSNRTPKSKSQNGAATSRSNMHKTRIGRAVSDAFSRSATPASTSDATPQRQAPESLGKMVLGSRRRSGRLAGKIQNLREASDIDYTDKDFFDSPYPSSAKKRKLSRLPATPRSSDDGDFVEDESEPDDEVPEGEDASDAEEVVSPTPATKGRLATRKARKGIKASLVPERQTVLKLKVPSIQESPKKSAPKPKNGVPVYMSRVVDEKVMDMARAYSTRQPVLFRPPVLSANRLKVDDCSFYLYAAEGCTTVAEMYASALSSSRFGGPRRHAPFRELHRLSDPHPMDTSDWAENIRWAKEQFKAFGSCTWTEYDYHLECITEHRRDILWVSEEVIMAGMRGA